MQPDRLVTIFKALGNENRFRILEAIGNSQRKCACCPDSPIPLEAEDGTLCCVDEIVGKFDMAQSTISQHLKELHQAGLLRRHKRAQWVFYTIDKDTLDSVTSFLQEFTSDLGQ